MIQELLVGGGVGVGIGGGGGVGRPMIEKCMVMGEERKAPDAAATAGDSQQVGLKCPRCDSSNTKFCYYNNYNLTQPRHFCKSCRRYWTKGGALRNVPIGGGCRKNKSSGGRSAKSKAESASNSKTSSTTTTITSTAATNNCGMTDREQPASSSAFTATTASPLVMQHSAATSISSLLLQNSHVFDPHSYLGILKPAGNQNSSILPQRSVSDAHNIEAMGVINGGVGMWRNGSNLQHYHHHHHHQNQPPYFHQNQLGLMGDQNGIGGCGGIQELYQKIRAMSSSYVNEEHQNAQPVMSANSIVEPTPLAVGELGYWGSALTVA